MTAPAPSSAAGDTPDAEAAFWAAHARINAQVHARCSGPARLVYCAYFETDEGLPESNLDEVAVAGACVLVGAAEGPATLAQWTSPPLDNPTWGQVAALVNQALIDAGESTFIHFEGLEWIEPYDAPRKRIAVCLMD